MAFMIFIGVEVMTQYLKGCTVEFPGICMLISAQPTTSLILPVESLIAQQLQTCKAVVMTALHQFTMLAANVCTFLNICEIDALLTCTAVRTSLKSQETDLLLTFKMCDNSWYMLNRVQTRNVGELQLGH